MYIPSTVSEVKDRIGAMVLCMPEYVDDISKNGVDGAYSELEHSLSLIRSKLGDTKYEKLLEMSRKSQQFFAEDKLKEGSFMLQDMHELI